MDRVFLITLAQITALIGLAQCGPAPALAQTFKHPGAVVEMADRRPIAVEVKAWPESKETGKQGDCPLFGSAPLDAKTSNEADGKFVLGVDKTKPTYTTTYCASEFFPRADRDHSNRRDGAPVMPTPVELVARGSGGGAAYEQLVRSRTVALLNDLAYLKGINPSEFDKVLTNFSKEVSKLSREKSVAVEQIRIATTGWRE